MKGYCDSQFCKTLTIHESSDYLKKNIVDENNFVNKIIFVDDDQTVLEIIFENQVLYQLNTVFPK